MACVQLVPDERRRDFALRAARSSENSLRASAFGFTGWTPYQMLRS